MENTEKQYSNSWLLLFIVLLAAIAPALAMFKVAPVMESIMAEFSLGSGQAGLVSTLFSLVPIILSIPVGVIVSKYGNWKFGLISLVFLIAGSLLGTFSTGTGTLMVSRVIEGAGMALIGTVGPNIVNEIFSPQKRGVAMGIFMCYISLGQAVINTIGPGLISASGSWRGIWWFTTIYGIVFLILWFFFLRKVDPEKSDETPVLSVGNALKNPGMWLLAGSMFFFMMAIQSVLMFYTSFFVQVKGLSSGYSANITSLHGYIGCLAAVVSGIIMDKLHTRKWFGVIIMIIAAVIYGFMPYYPAQLAVVQVLALGFTANLFPPIVFSGMPDVCNKAGEIPISLGVANTCMNLGSFLAGIVFGSIIDNIGWNGAFVYVVVMALLTALCMLANKRLKK